MPCLESAQSCHVRTGGWVIQQMLVGVEGSLPKERLHQDSIRSLPWPMLSHTKVARRTGTADSEYEMFKHTGLRNCLYMTKGTLPNNNQRHLTLADSLAKALSHTPVATESWNLMGSVCLGRSIIHGGVDKFSVSHTTQCERRAKYSVPNTVCPKQRALGPSTSYKEAKLQGTRAVSRRDRHPSWLQTNLQMLGKGLGKR